MLQIRSTSRQPRPRALLLAAGRRVWRKYRQAHRRRIQRREYGRLKSVIPSLASTDGVHKVTVIEEAIKYIDQLHLALARRFGLLQHVDCQAATEQVTSDRLSEIVQSFVTGAILQGQGHYLQQQTEYLSQCHHTATSPSPPVTNPVSTLSAYHQSQ